ncbi:MAG: tetratricopeptide repeat protein [Streptosporangiaceae bacterium]
MRDIDEAVHAGSEAVTACESCRAHRPAILDIAAAALRRRFARSRNIADIDLAVRFSRHAVALTPDGSRQPARLSSLALALQERFARTGNRADLDEAVQISRTAFEAAGTDRSLGSLANNLSLALRRRYGLTKSRPDLDEAIELARAAAAAVPPGHPIRADRLSNLAHALRARYRRTGLPTDLDTAIASWHEATNTTSAASLTRLESATSSASATAKARGLPMAAPAYATAVSLLPLVACRGIPRTDQEFHLRTAGASLGPDSAAAAVAGGRHGLAIELLEAGRSVQWSQLLEIRSDLRSLEHVAPALASALRNCRTHLDEQLEDFPTESLDDGGLIGTEI